MTLKGPEHTLVRQPLIERLLQLGWQEDQIQWSPEWRVPKSPSEAAKRDGRRSFDGFPVDVVLFDHTKNAGQFDHAVIIFETKKPDELSGITQLKIYLNLEPAVRLGVWTNGSQVVRVYRAADGTLEVVRGRNLPAPGESLLLAGAEPLNYRDLKQPTAKELKDTFQRILDNVVARDTKSTRRDDQLNQLCNLLLTKLESDKLAKIDPTSAVMFQFVGDEAATSEKIRTYFRTLRGAHADLFDPDELTEIALSDHTISIAAYELGALRLYDIPMDVMAHAFQVFRAASLKSEEGQYYTPYAVIKSVVKLMEVHPSDLVIDPACGTGGFLIETFRSLRERYPDMESGDAKQWAQRHLFGVDKDRINIKLTKAMMLIVGDGSTHTFRADSLSTHTWPEHYPHITGAIRDGTFTLVLTNPPFGEKLTYPAAESKAANYSISRAPKSANDYATTYFPNKYVPREVGLIFLERCHRLLAKGGRLGIILPETYFFSKSYMWFQAWANEHFILRAIVNIPMEAFQGFCRAKTNFYILEKK